MDLHQLSPLADRAMLWHLLTQDALERRLEPLGEWGWDVDLEEGTLTFRSDSAAGEQLEVRIALLASIAPGPRSLMWGWALPQHREDSPAERLLSYGKEQGLTALTQAEVPFPDLGEEEAPGDAARRLAVDVAAAASEILGLTPIFTPDAGRGTRAVILLDLDLEPVTVTHLATALPRYLSRGVLRDVRTSLWGLARHQGWHLAWDDEQFSGVTVSDGSVTAQFVFDDRGRVTSVSTSR